MIKIESDFPHGSIGDLREIRPRVFRGTTRHWQDRSGLNDQQYWFYFRVTGASGQSVRFELEDLRGLYRGSPHCVFAEWVRPVASRDGRDWWRIERTEWSEADARFSFEITCPTDSVWIAYAHPYNLADEANWLQCMGDAPGVVVERVGVSHAGREISVVTLLPPEGAATPRNIVMTSLLHPGEDCTAHSLEGLGDFLLSANATALRLRREFNWHLFPILNPDGQALGTCRVTANGMDANAVWSEPLSFLEREVPEVACVQRWLDRLSAAGSIDLFLDWHSHSQFSRGHGFFSSSSLFSERLVPALARLQPWPWSIQESASNAGTAGAYVRRLGIASATVELSQSQAANAGPYLTLADYHAIGRDMALAIAEVFDLRLEGTALSAS